MPPIRETERDWDKDLAEDVKGECESKYGHVLAIKVEKESQVCPSFSMVCCTSLNFLGRDIRQIRRH